MFRLCFLFLTEDGRSCDHNITAACMGTPATNIGQGFKCKKDKVLLPINDKYTEVSSVQIIAEIKINVNGLLPHMQLKISKTTNETGTA